MSCKLLQKKQGLNCAMSRAADDNIFRTIYKFICFANLCCGKPHKPRDECSAYSGTNVKYNEDKIGKILYCVTSHITHSKGNGKMLE